VLGFIKYGVGGGNGCGFDFAKTLVATQSLSIPLLKSPGLYISWRMQCMSAMNVVVFVVVLASSGCGEYEFGDACPDMLLHGCMCCEAGDCHAWAL
jgi:hypothetical protein